MSTVTYEQDFFSWTVEQAALLKQRRFDLLDIAHLVGELEEMGQSEKRALVSFIEVLLMHLLKWQYEPSHRSTSWELSIVEHRDRIIDHLADNPGLKGRLGEHFAQGYKYARLGAARETGLPLKTFPTECPWTYEQVIQDDFLPSQEA